MADMDPRLLPYYSHELQHVRDMGAEFAGPRLSGRRRPLGKFGPVPWRRVLNRHVGPLHVERVDAGKDLTDLERVRRRHRRFGQFLSLDPPVDKGLRARRDRLWHWDAGGEGRSLSDPHARGIPWLYTECPSGG